MEKLNVTHLASTKLIQFYFPKTPPFPQSLIFLTRSPESISQILWPKIFLPIWLWVVSFSAHGIKGQHIYLIIYCMNVSDCWGFHAAPHHRMIICCYFMFCGFKAWHAIFTFLISASNVISYEEKPWCLKMEVNSSKYMHCFSTDSWLTTTI